VLRPALIPGLEAEEEESLIARRGASQQAEPGDRVVKLHSLGLSQNTLDLFQHLIRPFQRGRGGKLDVQERIAVILFGQEARREPLPDEAVHCGEQHDYQHAYYRLADQGVTPTDITVRRLLEQPVEAAEESSEQSSGFFPGPQQQRGERGRKGQRVE